MNIQEGKLTSADGLGLFWQAWLPEKGLKAVVHVMHGYAEYIGRYLNVVDKLVPAGFAVCGNDHRGHGKSDGKRGHVESFSDYIEDEKLFSKKVVRDLFPECPYFVLGHSMGSIIATNFVEKYPEGLTGLVLSGTGSLPGKDTGKTTLLLAKVGSKLFPRLNVKFPLGPEFISRDPEVVQAYIDDPLTYNVITPRLANEMYVFLDKGARNAGQITLPVLVQCGSEDISFSGQQQFADSLGSTDKTFKLYQGLKHEVYNELPEDRDKVLSDLLTWLNVHI